MKKQIMFIASALLMSGCGIYSKYAPVTQVDDNLYGEVLGARDAELTNGGSGSLAALSADTAVSFGAMNWREVFTDPKLKALIEKGLENNTNLLMAQQRVEEAQATLHAARLAFLPSFALAPQGAVSSFDGNKATQTYSLPLTASWELDVFGRMRNSKMQAKALYAQSIDFRQAVTTQLIAQIANVYYTLLMLDEQLRVTVETEQTWEETVESIKALMNAGMADESAVAQMEAARHSVVASEADLRRQINETENSLALLLAETPRHYDRSTIDMQTVSDTYAAGVPLSLLSMRPDVRSAQRSLESAFYGVAQARSNFYPSITLSGSAGWTNSAGAMIVNPGKFLASALGQLTMPLFNRGQLSAQLKIAKAQQEEARLSFEQTLLNAGSEVNNSITALQAANMKAESLEKRIAALEEALRGTQLLMEHGTTTYLEVLTARQSLLSARLEQTSNRFARLQGVVNLYQALGGGE